MQMARNGPGGGSGSRPNWARSSSISAICGICSTRRTPSFRNASQLSRVTPMPMVAARAVSRNDRLLQDQFRTPFRVASVNR
jgi:hypothetical protein